MEANNEKDVYPNERTYTYEDGTIITVTAEKGKWLGPIPEAMKSYEGSPLIDISDNYELRNILAGIAEEDMNPTMSVESMHSKPWPISQNSPLYGFRSVKTEIEIPYEVKKIKNEAAIRDMVNSKIIPTLYSNLQYRIIPYSSSGRSASNIHIYDNGTNERLCHTFYINTVRKELYILVTWYYFHNVRTQKQGGKDYKANPTVNEFKKMTEFKEGYENELRRKYTMESYKDFFLGLYNGDTIKAKKDYENFIRNIYGRTDWLNA